MGIIEQIREIRLQEAEEEGEERKSRQVIKKLLAKGDYSIQEIADLFDVDVDFVIEVKNES